MALSHNGPQKYARETPQSLQGPFLGVLSFSERFLYVFVESPNPWTAGCEIKKRTDSLSEDIVPLK